jgi:hypothetical protein
MFKGAYCIVATEHQAEAVVEQLKNSGFSNQNISVLFPEKHETRDSTHRQDNKGPEGAAVGAGTGALLGGALGWLLGISTLAIPGVGPLIAAGPIVAAIGGAAIGTTLGGLLGGIIGLGIPEEEARRYEGKIREGNIMILVHSSRPEEIQKARRIFEAAGAQDISYTEGAGGTEGVTRHLKAS